MKIKIKYNHWLPKKVKADGLVIYPYVLLRHPENKIKRKKALHHEWVHIQQIRKDGLVKFYFGWFTQLIKNLFRYKNVHKAYRNISYESEAYKKMWKISLPKRLE